MAILRKGVHGYTEEKVDMAILRKGGHGYNKGKDQHCYIEVKGAHGYT